MPAWSYGYGVSVTSVSADEPVFWMGDRLAYDLKEISHDPSSMDRSGFWAVFATFEGEWTCARFGRVEKYSLPPISNEWKPVGNEWISSITEMDYISYVHKIRERISQGWVYQVNACREISAPFSGESLLPLMHQIAQHNPSPFASYLRLPGIEIASASPELFLKREADVVTSAPIKGTKSLAENAHNFGAKDTAENVM